MEFIVKGRYDAGKHESDGRAWACISIGSFDGDWPNITAVNRMGLLKLHFHDADEKAEDAEVLTLFSEAHADQILDFFNQHKDVDYILVHCTAGRSRSPAVAAAITKILGGDDSVWFRIKTPNALVYRTLLNRAFDRNLIQGLPENMPESDGRFCI